MYVQIIFCFLGLTVAVSTVGAQSRKSTIQTELEKGVVVSQEDEDEYGQMAQQMAAGKYFQLSRQAMQESGYDVSDQLYDEKSGCNYFEIKKGNVKNKTSRLINTLNQRGLHVSIGFCGSSFDNGVYVNELSMIILSPYHVARGADFLTTSVIHEINHAFEAKNIKNGRAGNYDAVIQSPDFEDVTNVADYPSYMSFDELQTHRADVILLRSSMPFVANPAEKTSLEEKINAKIKTVEEIKEAIQTITKIILDKFASTAIEFQEDPERKNAIVAKITYVSPQDKSAVVSVWLPELGFSGLGQLPEAMLKSTLKEKLLRIYNNAKAMSVPKGLPASK